MKDAYNTVHILGYELVTLRLTQPDQANQHRKKQTAVIKYRTQKHYDQGYRILQFSTLSRVTCRIASFVASKKHSTAWERRRIKVRLLDPSSHRPDSP